MDTFHINLFLTFLEENGFNPENYQRILELNSSVSDSISQYIKEYQQFLLSKKVNYSELDNYEVNGAKGYLTSF